MGEASRKGDEGDAFEAVRVKIKIKKEKKT
jgi:hypothetical protein